MKKFSKVGRPEYINRTKANMFVSNKDLARAQLKIGLCLQLLWQLTNI